MIAFAQRGEACYSVSLASTLSDRPLGFETQTFARILFFIDIFKAHHGHWIERVTTQLHHSKSH